MAVQDIKNIYKAVCEAPSGTGFHIDHMPDFLYKGDVDDGTPHVHTFYEILWFQEGTGTHFVDFQEYPVRPGTIFFLTPGQVHHFDGSSAYKCVNECSGRSPLAFITERIMLEAKRQVRYSNLMIKEIAYNLGFEDPSYFVKLFKRQTGLLPSDFRGMDEVPHCVAGE